MFRNMDETGDHYVKWRGRSKNEKCDIFHSSAGSKGEVGDIKVKGCLLEKMESRGKGRERWPYWMCRRMDTSASSQGWRADSEDPLLHCQIIAIDRFRVCRHHYLHLCTHWWPPKAPMDSSVQCFHGWFLLSKAWHKNTLKSQDSGKWTDRENA